jgi:hypothetical protein
MHNFFLDLWGQCGGSNRKCEEESNKNDIGDRVACEEIAKNAGHQFYQYSEDRGICHSVTSCESPKEGTSWDWKIYGQECGGIFSFSKKFFNAKRSAHLLHSRSKIIRAMAILPYTVELILV